MSIGEKIIREIENGKLQFIEKSWSGLRISFRPCSADQLQALVEQHIRELTAGEIERIRKNL